MMFYKWIFATCNKVQFIWRQETYVDTKSNVKLIT